MEPVVILGTAAIGLSVRDVRHAYGARPHEALFEVWSHGLSAIAWVHEHPDFSRLTEFFSGLERSWRGWDGTREWVSLEGELAITAEHTRTHVDVTVTMRGHEGWTASTEIAVGPGEEISNAVRAAELLFS
jgi:Family of unknown function (DUF6228)